MFVEQESRVWKGSGWRKVLRGGGGEHEFGLCSYGGGQSAVGPGPHRATWASTGIAQLPLDQHASWYSRFCHALDTTCLCALASVGYGVAARKHKTAVHYQSNGNREKWTWRS